jgi:hypothetical protein
VTGTARKPACSATRGERRISLERNQLLNAVSEAMLWRSGASATCTALIRLNPGITAEQAPYFS